ncbi:MAG TPA: DNA polymerase IV [Verrucomicrobiae bacterium]
MRSIVHLDADAFFASVEQAADPRLRGKPIAVGGERRGIIASASYEARKLGVYTPMPTSRARKLCPKLIVLPGDFDKYERFSRWMFSYAYDFTPDVEISSIDEGYFDLSATRKAPVRIAEKIREAIRQALKISVSEGIGSNKLISQIASKLNKPAGFVQVPDGAEKQYLEPLSNRWLPGVGPQMSARLNSAGLVRIGQIASTPLELLHLMMGNMARSTREFAHGRDERPLVPVGEPAKSYSQQETFGADTTDEEYVEALLRRMADNLTSKVREEGKSIRTVTIKVRYNDMDETQRSESLVEPTDLETDVYPRLRPMLRRAWERRVSLRMVSLKFSNIYDGVFRSELPLEVDARKHDAQRRLAATVDALRKTHGPRVLFRGHDFVLAREPENACAPAPARRAGPQVNYAQAAFHIQPARVKPYIPLHLHSYYSFLNSTLSIRAIQELAIRHELPAIAMTDQAGLYGAVEFVQAAKVAGFKPLVGAEISVGGRPLRLLVETTRGYQNLCRILSLQNSRGPAMASARKSRREAASNKTELFEEQEFVSANVASLDSTQKLEGLTDGLIALSPDPKFSTFFPGAFYLEISDPAELSNLSAPNRLPMVASMPVHYASPADRKRFHIVQSIRTLTLLRQEHPEKQLAGDFHFRPPREMRELFRQRPELVDRTHEIAARCTFQFPFGKPQFAAYAPPHGASAEAFLRRLVLAGLQRRYGSKASQVRRQIEEELAIIAEVGYEEYFLVVWDLLQMCRERGIAWITRGSAADSLVCYCLGISDVCPIRFGLFFERFLNRERMQMNKLPDIDVDFPHDRKDDVIDLIFQKFGREHTAVVGGFSTYLARGAVADVAKVLGVSEYQVRRFTENFPWTSARGIGELVRQSQDCRDLPLDEDPYKSALQMAEFLDGFPRYAKMHPCGLVLSRQPMMELTPTFTSNKGYPTTHYDMDAVETIGLVKLDILAQGGLSVMRDIKSALAGKGIEIDLERMQSKASTCQVEANNINNGCEDRGNPPSPAC